MTEAKSAEIEGVKWRMDNYTDLLGATAFITGVPLLDDTNLAIATFPEPKKVLEMGPIFDRPQREAVDYLAMVDPTNARRVYALPGTIADTRLSLTCFREGDSCSWEANSAYFRKGGLVAIVSNFSYSLDPSESHTLVGVKREMRPSKLLRNIYEQEVGRVARDLLCFGGEESPFGEIVRVLKAESPQGEGLHNSYRDAVKEILEDPDRK